jgi:(S)-sulfolactate dehydrogenase
MKKIVISEFMDPAAIDELKNNFDVIYDPGLVDQPDLLLAELKTADAIIVRNRTQVRGDLLACAEKLKAVGRLGVGLDNIDLDACNARQIEVLPAHGANNTAVAEYVIASIFILLRSAYQSHREMVEGQWPRTALMGNETAGKVLGIIGYGAIGRETCRKAAAMGMRVIAYHPSLPADDPAWQGVKSVGFEEVLATADVISLHVPLTDQTRHMIDARAIAGMKKGALLINTARGGVVDENALVKAMKSGQIGGAAIDVFETEPLNAKMGQKFKGLPNLILTPHIAGVTTESNRRVSELTAENISNALG